MANVTALLAQYQAVKSQISYYTLEELKWQGLHESMTEKVSKWTTYSEDWNEGSQSYVDKHDENNGKLIKKGQTFLWTTTKVTGEGETKTTLTSGKYMTAEGGIANFGFTENWDGWAKENGLNVEVVAELFANLHCPQFAKNGADKLEEYTNLDMEYDAMLTTMETMLTSLRAQEESLKTAVGEGAKDTGMGTGG